MADAEEQKVESDVSIDTATLLRMQPLAAGLSRLYCSEGFTDLEIICQERVWKVHTLCLCAQSDFFQSACGGNFLEAANNRISLDEDDPQTVACFIHYLYHFDYINFKQTGISPIVLDVRMYIIADKYLVNPLKQLATKKFEEGARAWWDTRAFADAVVEVYESAGKDGPMKEIVIKIVEQYANDLLDVKKKHHYFLNVLGEIPEFGKDVSTALVASSLEAGADHVCRCPRCASSFAIKDSKSIFRCPYCDNVESVTRSKTFYWDRYLVKD